MILIFHFGQYVDENIYNNSPLKYLNGMSRNHPYVDLYNQRHIILCCGQGAWEDEMVKSTGLMKETFDRLVSMHGVTLGKRCQP